MHNNPLLVTSPNKIVLKCLLSLPNLVLNVLNDVQEQEFEGYVRDLLVPPDLLPVLVTGNGNDDEREVDYVSRWLMVKPKYLVVFKMVTAILSIFHDPCVESILSTMRDMIRALSEKKKILHFA